MSTIKIEAQSIDELFARIKRDMHQARDKILEECGEVAEGHAKLTLTSGKLKHPTGNLSSRIEHKRDKDEVYIGTNVEYGKYVEFGTGEYATKGGRLTPWVYQDENGDWHRTTGMRAVPFLKPAIADHKEEYKKIIIKVIKDEFKSKV